MRDEMLGKEEGVSREERIKFLKAYHRWCTSRRSNLEDGIAVSNGVADAIAR